MELNEKLQELRKKRGLTQEELSEALFVSRTAISKWESGRGYPSIESLKAIAGFYGVSIDELLSGKELLTLAEEDGKQKERHIRDLVFGLLDCCFALFIFLPFFGETADSGIREVSLLALTGVAPYLKIAYWIAVIGTVWMGIAMLALQNCTKAFWRANACRISLGLGALSVVLFIISQQPYAASFSFVFLMIKALMLIKWQ